MEDTKDAQKARQNDLRDTATWGTDSDESQKRKASSARFDDEWEEGEEEDFEEDERRGRRTKDEGMRKEERGMRKEEG